MFYLSGDDNSELWLSTDASPANKVKIAYEPIWNSARAWQSTMNRNPSNPEMRSAPIRLEVGRAYYLEVLQKEGGGGDHVEVAWKMPGGSPPVDGSEPIPGRYFSANPPTQDQLPVKTIPAAEGTLVVNPANHHGYYLLAPSSWHEAEAAAESEFEVPVRLTTTGRLTSVQFSLAWNPSVFELVRTGSYGLRGFGEGNLNSLGAAAGRLSVSWDDPEGQGVVVDGNTGRIAIDVRAPGSAGISAGTPSSLERVAVPTARSS